MMQWLELCAKQRKLTKREFMELMAERRAGVATALTTLATAAAPASLADVC